MLVTRDLKSPREAKVSVKSSCVCSPEIPQPESGPAVLCVALSVWGVSSAITRATRGPQFCLFPGQGNKEDSDFLGWQQTV